jgi:hypothetical protein
MHVDWIRWFEALKRAVEQPLTSGMIPDIPFTKIAMTASPRLLGRTSSGAGPAEEITVSGPLTLGSGALGITGSALTKTDDTNVTLTLGGSPTTALLAATSLTLGWTGVLSVARGGTGTGTAFTQGSVIFAGSGGTFAEDNANLFWDDTNNKLGIGTLVPKRSLHVNDGGPTNIAAALLPGAVVALLSGAASGTLQGVAASTAQLHRPGLYLRGIKAAGTLDTPAAVVADHLCLFAEGEGYDGTSRQSVGNIGLFVESVDAGAVGAQSKLGGYINFLTQPLLGIAGPVEAMRIASTGNVAIGTTVSTAARLTLRSTAATLATKAAIVEDSAGTDLFAVRDDSSVGVGKNVTVTTNSIFFYLATNADYGGLATITNNTNGISAAVGFCGGELRYLGSQEFTNARGISMDAGCSNTNTINAITAVYGNARITAASGRAATLIGGRFQADSNDSTGGTVTTLAGLRSTILVNNASVTATNAYGLHVADLTNTGTMTNTYGVHVGDITAGTQTNTPFSFYASDANAFNYLAGRIGAGTTAPTAVLHLKAGTATANTAPLKFTTGTNLGTAEAGTMEYDGTNLFFTRAGTVRENVLVAIDNVTAPTTTPGVIITNYYGSAATNFLGDPNRWLSVNILGTTYKIPLYT